MEAYYGEIKDTKSLENLIDKLSEQKLTTDQIVQYIVEDCLNVRTTKAELDKYKSNIDFDKSIGEIMSQIDELKNKSFDDIKFDNDARNKTIDNINDPITKIMTAYISTKDIPLPEIETIAKTSSASQDPRFKDLSTRELIEQTDKVPGSIVKNLKLPIEQAKIIKELNYKTFIQIVQTNPAILNQDLIIDAIKHEKSMDKLQDKLIQKNNLAPNARTKYGSKIAKAVVNYSIDKVFGNSIFKKSSAAKEIKTELDAINLLSHFITSGQTEKNPKSIVDTNQTYVDTRITLKNKATNQYIEEQKKKNNEDLENLRNQLADIVDQKEAAENRDLNQIIATIDGITGGFDVDKVSSRRAQKNKETGTTLCSKTACININNILEIFDKDSNEDVLK